jgi:hypothetical protein
MLTYVLRQWFIPLNHLQFVYILFIFILLHPFCTYSKPSLIWLQSTRMLDNPDRNMKNEKFYSQLGKGKSKFVPVLN